MATATRLTKVCFYGGVPLDDENTLYFGNPTSLEQVKTWFDYFKVVETDATLSYQRDTSYVRIGVAPGDTTTDKIKTSDLHKCNWISFINLSHENTYVFAEITQVEYINSGTYHIHFKIDYWLSYINTISNVSGLIERQHYTRELAPNTSTGLRYEQMCVDEYQSYYHDVVSYSNLMYIVNVFGDTDGKMLPNIIEEKFKYPSIHQEEFADLGSLVGFLQSYVDHPEVILKITIFPVPKQTNITLPLQHDISDQVTNPWSKCWKYPNTVYRVSNNLGREKFYMREWFYQGSAASGSANGISPAEFDVVAMLNGSAPTISLIPKNYKGVQYNYAEQICYDKFPAIQWPGDSFGMWWAVNGLSTIITTAGSVAIGAATGGLGLAAGGMMGINTVSSVLTQMKQSDRLFGAEANGGALNITMNELFTIDILGAQGGLMSANNKYWSMYGYLSGHAGEPNLNNNPVLNYVKGDFSFNYGGPRQGHTEIKKRFANGVRLWHTSPANFGDYSLDNRA